MSHKSRALLQISRPEPSARGQIVKLLRRRIDEHDTICVRRVLKLRIRNLRINGLTVEKNDLGRLVAVKNGWRNLRDLADGGINFLSALHCLSCGTFDMSGGSFFVADH